MLIWPAPAAPRACMQRLMSPIRGFRQDFPFVTPPVTWQVECTGMFPECVMTSSRVALDHSPAPFAKGRHIAVTLPGYALELIRIADVRLQPREVGKRLPVGGRILF